MERATDTELERTVGLDRPAEQEKGDRSGWRGRQTQLERTVVLDRTTEQEKGDRSRWSCLLYTSPSPRDDY